jgi:hypothetical protein
MNFRPSPSVISLALAIAASATTACGGAGEPSSTGSASQTETATEAVGVEAGKVTQYSCSSPDVGTFDATAKVVGHSPTSTSVGDAVSLTKFDWTVTLPASLINEAISVGATSASGDATTLDVKATESTPASVNAAKTEIAFGPVPLVKNEALSVSFPADPEKLNGFKAKAAGTMTFTPGDMNFNVTLNPLGTQSVTCTTTKGAVISKTTVN